jgi:hypothetical protein
MLIDIIILHQVGVSADSRIEKSSAEMILKSFDADMPVSRPHQFRGNARARQRPLPFDRVAIVGRQGGVKHSLIQRTAHASYLHQIRVVVTGIVYTEARQPFRRPIQPTTPTLNICYL